MTLPGEAPVADALADPFGMWQLPALKAGGEMVSFGLPEGGGAPDGEELPSAVWTLPLHSGSRESAAGEVELGRRAAQVQAIDSGLEQADLRVEAFLAGRQKQTGAVSFDVGSAAEPLPVPEAGLAYALTSLEQAEPGGESVSFGLGQDLSRLAARSTGVDWGDLQQRFGGLMDSINRQILHFAWVDTTLDGNLAARTTVNWGGDLVTFWQSGLGQEQSAAHCRSLQLALASRSANLRTVLTVSKIAGKITLAVTTPLGPLQAMSLGWQFVHEVVIPLLQQAK